MSSAVGRKSVSADSIDSSIWSSSLSSLSTSSLSDQNSIRRASLEQQAQCVQAQTDAQVSSPTTAASVPCSFSNCSHSGLVSTTPQRTMVDDQNHQTSILSDNTVDTGLTDASSLSSHQQQQQQHSSPPPKLPRNGGCVDMMTDEVIEQIIAKELPQQQPRQPRHKLDTQDEPHSLQESSFPSSSFPSSSEKDLSFHTPPTPSSTKFANGVQDSKQASPQSDCMTESRATLNGAMSPTGSRSSIARDISAPYREHQLMPEPPIDENLYGLVDRYGFLVEDGRQPSIERRRPSTSGYARDMEESLHAKQVELELTRSIKWARMATRTLSITKETVYMFNHPKFAPRIYKGIPDCWRTAAWSYLITNRGRDADMDINLRERYPRLCSIPSPEEEQIDLDIPRTMHGHIMFKARYGSGQCALFNVLKAYSNYDSQVGYCQGMASVVATMLTFFDEEKTFVLLAHLFRRYNLHSLVIPGFPALFEAFYIQDELTKRFVPKVSAALETMNIPTSSYASRWHITLFAAGVVPYRTLLRIWDVLFLEGFEWMYFVALALLKYHEAKLIQSNFEQTMEMLNARITIWDDDRLIKIARKFYRRAQRSNMVARLKGQYVELEKARKAEEERAAAAAAVAVVAAAAAAAAAK